MPTNDKKSPIPPQHHDLVVFPIPSAGLKSECIRFPVNRDSTEGEVPGTYTKPPELHGITGEGQRKVLSFMRPSRFDPKDDSERRGPAFAVAAVKAEPAQVGIFTCFLINAEYFAQPNHWTVEEWNEAPDGPDYPPKAHPEEIDVLVALPWGKVLRLHVNRPGDAWEDWKETKIGPAGKEFGALSPFEVKHETEVWYQLRNGCIAGRSWVSADKKTVPLVNITALL